MEFDLNNNFCYYLWIADDDLTSIDLDTSSLSNQK